MIKWSAFPYARSGIASAVVLGFGRALGETIAVAIVLSSNYLFVSKLFTPGGNTIAANIATQFGDAGKVGTGALIASGLVLFVITLVVNLVARAIARQSTPAGSVV
jgi:ABC-type phosphate transport system permease subunit